jgi:predicted negative regulator of RcsB-dependent stress response
MISECELVTSEPMEGLSSLIKGAVLCCLGQTDEAVASFRACLEQRKGHPTNMVEGEESTGDHHISAFAMYELASILCQNQQVSWFINILYYNLNIILI